MRKKPTPEYVTWKNIKQRTTNPNRPDYARYGGRGIKVCERWAESFQAFFEDMGPRPGPEYSIERVDNNDDYTPWNCHWATDEKQANNKRNNHMLIYNGRTQSMAAWARELGLNYYRVRGRANLGWSVDKILDPRAYKTNGRLSE